MLSGITQASSRQREIIEVVFRNGWDYMRQLLLGSGTGEPELPPPEILRNVLTELGPVYVKLGQLLSTRPDLLSPDYIDALSDLQAKVPTVPWSEVETVIRKELNTPFNDVFESINPTAIAAGSIAQIHRAVLKNGQAVAIKVQRPGIGSIVEQDVSLIKSIAELVSRTSFGQYY
ncbi:MAG: AarF/UbiB family protein, partial [Cyanobacteria bacterium J06626_14]